MYIHIGSDMAVHSEHIVGIFDIDYCSVTKNTRRFLADAEKAGRVINVSEDIPKTFIVVCRKGKTQVCISPVSANTLRKRSGTIY